MFSSSGSDSDVDSLDTALTNLTTAPSYTDDDPFFGHFPKVKSAISGGRVSESTVMATLYRFDDPSYPRKGP